jgi:hypothetical protein
MSSGKASLGAKENFLLGTLETSNASNRASQEPHNNPEELLTIHFQRRIRVYDIIFYKVRQGCDTAIETQPLRCGNTDAFSGRNVPRIGEENI